MPKKKAPQQVSAYLVTASDIETMPVNSVLIDKGALLHAEWNVMDFNTGETTHAVGVRLLRLCPTCRNEHRIAGVLGHDGECGSEPVREEAHAEIRHAKKEAAA